MGQYYTPIMTRNGKTTLFCGRKSYRIIDGKRVADDYQGAKIMEHSWIGNNFMDAFAQKLYNKKARVAWVGDYTDGIMSEVKSNDGTVAPLGPNELYSGCYYKQNADGTLYHNDKGYIEEDNDRPLPQGVKVGRIRFDKDFIYAGKFFINHSKKEYLDLTSYIKRSMTLEKDYTGEMSEWTINPISLLTSTGGDQGGGDYHGGYPDADKVGIWAYDLVEIKDKAPKGYNEIKVTFKEQTEPAVGVA